MDWERESSGGNTVISYREFISSAYSMALIHHHWRYTYLLRRRDFSTCVSGSADLLALFQLGGLLELNCVSNFRFWVLACLA